MRRDMKINGKDYELQITTRVLLRDGCVSVSMSDADTEALLGHGDNRLVVLDMSEYELIMKALNHLSESREDEIKWACGDKDIVEPDQDCIDNIEALQEKLRDA